MIITCEQCSTKFNLDDSILKKEGSKVRCSICRFIFKAYPDTTSLKDTPDDPKDIDTTFASDYDELTDSLQHELKLDLDFSLDDDISKTVSLQKSLSAPVAKPADIDTENGFELDLDFSLDDDISKTVSLQKSSSTPVTQPADIDTENGFELDLDFSLDDNADFTQSPVKTTSKLSSPPLSLNKENLEKDEALSIDNGLELDIDFSLDSGDGMDIPVSHKSSLKPFSPTVDMDGGLELDMDFSIDEDMPINTIDSEQGLELSIEDDSEIDFDFSLENEHDSKNTNAIKSTTEQYNIESISPMDMDFSMDDEIDSDEDTVDGDYDAIIDDTIIDINNNSNPMQSTENRLSFTKSVKQETTLGGHPIRSSSKTSTILEDKPNLFEESPLFDKKRKRGTNKILILTIVFILLAIAGYTAFIVIGIKIPYLSNITIPYLSEIKIPYINKILSPPQEPIKLTPNQKTVSGKFITNTISGTLFIITGEVSNHSKLPCKEIKIEGTLIATNKAKVNNKTVLCGNVIPEEQLKTLDMNAINAILYSSDESKKFTVEPGQSIPFMVVFSDFPDNLENFTVTVKNFKTLDPKQ